MTSEIIALPKTEQSIKNPSLTGSYIDTFWRHGKQLLKGAAVLGAGILGYGTWRFLARESSVVNENNYGVVLRDELPNTLNNELSSVIWKNEHTNIADNEISNRKNSFLRRQANNCLTEADIGEFRINTYTFVDQNSPVISALANGGFVAAWQSALQDGSGYGIFAQRYAASGVPLGSEFRVNTYWANDQSSPAIAGLSDGGFVAAWQSAFQDGSGYGIFAQRYAVSGLPLGSEFRVNTYLTNDQYSPAIASLVDGGFVMVWTSYGQGLPAGTSIYGQRYDSGGVALGNEFQVSNSVYAQDHPTITGLTDGSLMIVWECYIPASSSVSSYYRMFGRWYSASGTPLNNEFLVNNYIASTQGSPAIIAWLNESFVGTSPAYDGSDNGIYAQHCSAAGTLYKLFQVNTYVIYDQSSSVIAGLSNESFVIVWQSYLQDGSGYGIYGQRYTAPSVRLGSVFLVNTYTIDDQGYPTIAGLLDKSFVVAWQSNGQDGSLGGIYGQRYWSELRVGNSCDSSYTEDINYPLGLWIAPLAYISPLNATLILQPPLSGQLISSANSTSTLVSYNSTLGSWFTKGAFSGVNNLLRGLSFIPALNFNQDVVINVLINDNTGSSFIGNFTLTGIPVNDAPVWINDQLTINQGEKRVLTRMNIDVDDVDNADSEIYITVAAVQYGQFEWISRPGFSISTFTLQNISSALVAFAHNNLAFAPSYTLIADDGMLTTPSSIVTVNFDLRPSIVNNALVIQKPGDTLLLTNLQILAQDNDNIATELVFTVTGLKNGRFDVATHKGEAASTFTQQDINDGLVRFIHDGSKETPSYTLTVSDGRMSSSPSVGDVTLNIAVNNNIPFTETTGFKTGASIAVTAVGTVIGFAAWRYRNHKDAEHRRSKSLIANIVRDDLGLSGVYDFESTRGVQFVEAITAVTKALERQDIDVIVMTESEQDDFAHKLAEILESYTSKVVPQRILEGNNKASRLYLSCYYLKVKPIIKSNACWMDTDKVKKEASAIAAQVKSKILNSTTGTAIISGDIEMQAFTK